MEKSEHEAGRRRAKFGGPLDRGRSRREIDDSIRGIGGCMKVSRGNQGD